jgi:hypothetical protein
LGSVGNFKCSRNLDTLKKVEEEINYNTKALNKIRGGKSKSKFEGDIDSGPESKEPTVADRRMLNDTAKGLTMPQAVLRIRDVYPGFRILIFTHPGSRISDPGSQVPDPGSKNSNKREG